MKKLLSGKSLITKITNKLIEITNFKLSMSIETLTKILFSINSLMPLKTSLIIEKSRQIEF
jgi:hypothetical protein